MSEITTDYNTVLDHIYSNTDLKNIGTIDNYWSDHKITSVTFKSYNYNLHMMVTKKS